MNDLLLASLSSGSLMAVGLVYLGGVLTSATPCVYPIIPITIGVIGGSSQNGRMQGFTHSLVYAVGLASVYSLLGIIAASSGRLFGEIATNPWGYFVVANLCLFFAAWMMEWIHLPQLGFSAQLEQPTKSPWLRLFLLGAVSGLVAGPCTAPVLAILLTFVATTGQALYGGLLLFVFAFGLSTLLIVVGTFSGLASTLPRSGAWMLWIKRGMALVMLAAGEYFLIQMGLLLF
jgi:thiol:disulfide interchange protein DsbD